MIYKKLRMIISVFPQAWVDVTDGTLSIKEAVALTKFAVKCVDNRK